MWGGDRWWGTHTTGHCWGSSGDFHFINPDFIIIIIVTMIIITVGHCWGSSSNINHCKCTLDKHILHFDNCEDHDHDQLMCVEPFEAEEEGTLAAIIINLSININHPPSHRCDDQLVCVEPFEAEEEGTLSARAGDRLLVLFPPNQVTIVFIFILVNQMNYYN